MQGGFIGGYSTHIIQLCRICIVSVEGCVAYVSLPLLVSVLEEFRCRVLCDALLLAGTCTHLCALPIIPAPCKGSVPTNILQIVERGI